MENPSDDPDANAGYRADKGEVVEVGLAAMEGCKKHDAAGMGILGSRTEGRTTMAAME